MKSKSKQELREICKERKIKYTSSNTKEELINLLEQEEKFISIKIKLPIIFKENTKVYSEEESTFKYEVGDIIEQVNVKYLERLQQFPEHVEILEEVN